MALYAARGGNAASDLYILDPSDASQTSVGNTGRALTGLAFDPTSGTLYGSTSNNSPLNARSLVTVNPANGVTTLVGSFGIGGSDTLNDLAFDSAGTLYGYSIGPGLLYTVNTSTGAATQVSATILNGYGYAMDFDSEDNLFVLADGDDLTPPSDITLVDQTDGSNSTFSHISGSPPYGNGAAFAAGTFAPARVFYAIDNDFGASTHLVTVNMGTGDVVDIGSVTAGMDALASDVRATSAFIFNFPAPTIINPDCATASVVGGTRVREDWLNWWDFGVNPCGREEMTFEFTWSKPPGLYRLNVTGQLAAGGGGVVNAIAFVNGRPFLGIGGTSFTNTTPGTLTVYNGFNAGTEGIYDVSDRALNPWLPLTTGDTVEVQIMSAADLTGFAGFDAFETSKLSFLAAGDDTLYCTGAIRFGDVPLGDDWGDVDGWGGQQLIPDEIWTHLGYTPDSHTTGVDFPWGVRWEDFDMVALEDGTIYFFIHDSFTVGAAPPSADDHYAVVKKYDPGTETWSQLATLAAPTGRKVVGSVSCEYDGTNVYFAWMENTTYTPGIPPLYQSDWHLVRLDPSDDSYTELGTGQHAVTAGTGVGQDIDNGEVSGPVATLAPHICVSGDDVYVSVVELIKVSGGGGVDEYRRPYVWRWNGSSWTDLNLPDPSVLGPTNPQRWEVTGENGFWDQLIMLVAADQNGPITDGITVVYSYWIRDNNNYTTVTIPYTTGGGWGTEILTDWVAVEGTWLTGASAYSNALIDHNILWSEKLNKLVLTGDLLRTPSDNIWDMWQMNDAGTQWENLDNVLAPADSAGDWRQSRNSAAIGPDGDIWRGTMADVVGSGLEFIPFVIKNADGYSFGYAEGERKPMVRIAPWTDPQGNVWGDGLDAQMYGTTNVRIRWSGNTAYMGLNLFVEPNLVNGQDFDTYAGDWPEGDGFYVLKGTYMPCVNFVFGSIKHP